MKKSTKHAVVAIAVLLGVVFIVRLDAQENTKKYLNRSEFIRNADLRKSGAKSQREAMLNVHAAAVVAKNRIIDGNGDGPYALTGEEESKKDVRIGGVTGETEGAKTAQVYGCPECPKICLNVSSSLHKLGAQNNLIDGTSDGPFTKR